MGYRWKPNKQQREEYRKRMEEANKRFNFIHSNGAIREGCYVEYVDKMTNVIIKGYITNSSYGMKSGQHTFTIGGWKLVKGRNLYDRLLVHKPGEMSKLVSKGR